MPVPSVETPRLKKRAWTAKRGESGKSRTAKGSSNDSSMDCSVRELSMLKGKFVQSNSINAVCKSIAHALCLHCIYRCHFNVFTLGSEKCQKIFQIFFA